MDNHETPSLVQRTQRISIRVSSASPMVLDTEYQSIKAIVPLWRQYISVSSYLITSSSVLILLFYFSYYAAKVNGQAPEMMSCRYFGYWTGPNCGLNGIDCMPFETDWFAFRCPKGCLSDQSSSLTIIGSGPYRGDSRICKAAIHAGAISSSGGCGLMKYNGSRMSFVGSTQHGVTSITFNSWFPKTMAFYTDVVSISHCTDLSWYILAIGALTCMGLAWFPKISPLVLIHYMCVWGYVYVNLIASPTSFDYPSIGLNLFTNIAFIIVAIHCWYIWVIKHTFNNYSTYSRKERFIHWSLVYVIPFHLMLHLTQFGYIPWLNVDVGGYTTNNNVNVWTYIVFALVGLLALVLAGFLLYQLYKQKALPWLLLGYIVLAIYMAIVYAMFSNTLLHLHHVQIGLLLLPATRFPSRTAMFVQAIGLGLFIQGYAAWGWPTFLDVLPASYYIDSLDTPPRIVNVTSTTANLTWDALSEVYGYALMLNGVEVARTAQNWSVVTNLAANLTYFVQVSGIGVSGADGTLGAMGNFTTLP
ncbi:hypothetical protein THRCLA_00842 [Thraustotheca clavata]|uniref:LCCL domain-containing protein n=1 Tax=Thraustotheca clavata TaxID=74557 RepID=A0A1W0AAD9_9STRA|nr:hypothetical protein THRCLA_00842 [Thraustotheca clavata]